MNNPALFSTSKPDISPQSNRKPALGQRETGLQVTFAVKFRRELGDHSRVCINLTVLTFKVEGS